MLYGDRQLHISTYHLNGHTLLTTITTRKLTVSRDICYMDLWEEIQNSPPIDMGDGQTLQWALEIGQPIKSLNLSLPWT